MSTLDEPRKAAAQPHLPDLLARFLHNRAVAQAAGLVNEATSEVVPFEAAPVQTVDARLAWTEAVAVARWYQQGTQTPSWQVPPDWPALVAAQEPGAALAFALGSFPQQVRHLQPLLHAGALTALRPTAAPALPAPALLTWANQASRTPAYPQLLLVLGTLRLGRQFEQAERLLAKQRGAVPAAWQAAWANEEAALAWQRGQGEVALQMWQAQPDSVPVLFNRGMALLFLGRPAEARPQLDRAVAQLDEASAWHHLGKLYQALAQARG